MLVDRLSAGLLEATAVVVGFNSQVRYAVHAG